MLLIHFKQLDIFELVATLLLKDKLVKDVVNETYRYSNSQS